MQDRKMTDNEMSGRGVWKMQDWNITDKSGRAGKCRQENKVTDKSAWLENAGTENDGN